MIKAEAHHRAMNSVQGPPIDWGQAAQPFVILNHPDSLGTFQSPSWNPHLSPPVTIIGAQDSNGLRSLA